jgi:hypothetical protein
MGLETIAVAALAASVGTQAYGQYQSGKAAEADAKNQSAILARNAQIDEQNARAAGDMARQKVRQGRTAAGTLLADNRALLAESGAVPTGSALLAMGHSASELENDLQQGFANDLLVSDTYTNQAVNSRLQGRAARMRGRSAKRNSYIGAGSTILSGAAKTYGMGYELGVW